jgi:transcriptional regulator with XRE-family HTH domain
MTAKEFRDALEMIGWGQRDVVRRVNMSQTHVRRWASGEYPVPEEVAVWLAKLAAAHADTPPPIMQWKTAA